LWLKTKQLILGTGTAIWWVTEPHWLNFDILKNAIDIMTLGKTLFTAMLRVIEQRYAFFSNLIVL